VHVSVVQVEALRLARASEGAAVLANFGWCWDQEMDASERNKILRLIFEHVTVDDARLGHAARGVRSLLPVWSQERG